jgi:hypothetical protein
LRSFDGGIDAAKFIAAFSFSAEVDFGGGGG